MGDRPPSRLRSASLQPGLSLYGRHLFDSSRQVLAITPARQFLQADDRFMWKRHYNNQQSGYFFENPSGLMGDALRGSTFRTASGRYLNAKVRQRNRMDARDRKILQDANSTRKPRRGINFQRPFAQERRSLWMVATVVELPVERRPLMAWPTSKSVTVSTSSPTWSARPKRSPAAATRRAKPTPMPASTCSSARRPR